MSESQSDDPAGADLEAILEVLESAGLAETYLDEAGRETMRLTDDGAALAREMGILEHGSGPDSGPSPDVPGAGTSLEPLAMPGTWGTAVGAAMLGFEQALRSEPPPEIMAAEHVPERGYVADDGAFVIEFPDPLERRDRRP